jgi:hypothetical protein
MKSHDYAFRFRDLRRILVGPIFVVGIVAGSLHAGARLRLLPLPRPTLDTDRTILVHQADMATKSNSAEVVLIGDSSCLMDVDARQLGEALGLPILNLGTLSLLDLGNYSDILRHYAESNPGRLKTVVLLMHPEALRRTGAEAYYVQVLEHFWAGLDYCSHSAVGDELGCVLGIEILRGRVLPRLVPVPLAGAFGHAYGFTADLENEMERRRGSIADPVVEEISGNPEYRLAPTIESFSRRFREAVPPGALLVVGITPVAATRAHRGFEEARSAMLKAWGAWLQADAILTSLPSTLPNNQFTRPAHLNGASVPMYTSGLVEALKTVRKAY